MLTASGIGFCLCLLDVRPFAGKLLDAIGGLLNKLVTMSYEQTPTRRPTNEFACHLGFTAAGGNQNERPTILLQLLFNRLNSLDLIVA
jgi:hypothetical protein